MLERGLFPDSPAEALAELDGILGPATQNEESTRDLRNLLWCAIDNDDSLDLDQLTVAESRQGGTGWDGGGFKLNLSQHFKTNLDQQRRTIRKRPLRNGYKN
jgi:hypothetical protein